MTVRLSDLSTLLLFVLVGAVLWTIRNTGVTVVTVPAWALESVDEEEDLPTWDDFN